MTPSLAEEVLSKNFGESAPPVIDAQKVLREVCKKFNVELTDLKGKCRSKDIVVPRQIAMYLMRELTDYSLPDDRQGDRRQGPHDGPSLVQEGSRRRMASDKAFAAQIDELTRQIVGGQS